LVSKISEALEFEVTVESITTGVFSVLVSTTPALDIVVAGNEKTPEPTWTEATWVFVVDVEVPNEELVSLEVVADIIEVSGSCLNALLSAKMRLDSEKFEVGIWVSVFIRFTGRLFWICCSESVSNEGFETDTSKEFDSLFPVAIEVLFVVTELDFTLSFGSFTENSLSFEVFLLALISLGAWIAKLAWIGFIIVSCWIL